MASDDPLDDAQSLLENGAPGEAAALLQALLDANRGGLLARLLLIRALNEAGDTARALEAAREAARLNPDAAAAVLALGETLLKAEHLPTAIAEIQRALRLDPNLDDARFALGNAWLAAGEPEKALAAFAEVQSHPNLEARITEAEHLRAMQRSNPAYVRHLFDQFSADYDARMIGQLGYAAPQILRGLANLVMPGARDLAILDLGCGTGLSGEAFKDMAATLGGIDLSPAMLEKARVRNIYDHLHVADIETALNENPRAYDLLLAADTLVYLGDLAATFAGAARALKQGGYFLFTVEAKDDHGFALGPKRRWAHAESYLREQAESAGFAVAGLLECSPRSEKGIPVPGFAVALALAENEG